VRVLLPPLETHRARKTLHLLLSVPLLCVPASPQPLLQEVASFDTVGNAYMSLCIHANPAAWRRIAVVTSDFHMPRSRALFADLFRLAGQSIYGDPAW
jgi:hypothetical protein